VQHLPYKSFTSALIWGERSASCLCPMERAPGTHWIGGWVGPLNRSGRQGEEKILVPARTRTPTPWLSSP
jgi:hypothetical protein